MPRAKTKPPAQHKAVLIPPGAPALLSIDQVAACLQFAARTVRKKRASKEFPEPDCYVFGEARWRPETVDQWIRRQPRMNTNGRRLPEEGEEREAAQDVDRVVGQRGRKKGREG